MVFLEKETEKHGYQTGHFFAEHAETETSVSFMICEFIKFAVPSYISVMIFYMQQMINVSMAGHLKEPKILAAIEMGNLIQNCLLISAIIGVNSAFVTLAS